MAGPGSAARAELPETENGAQTSPGSASAAFWSIRRSGVSDPSRGESVGLASSTPTAAVPWAARIAFISRPRAEQGERGVGDREGDEETVNTIEHAAHARQEAARVLRAEAPLDEGFQQVAPDRREPGGERERSQ